ncbi:M15 family metallopeptidase [Pseudomonas schmalbachii]|uniref:D-alanyl-D-alanine dipeptidase n=1 Tax=Pseudomonas schmalbachii TaxID=2816993 RepID=A0ABS3TQE4_9PSED|nr:M15 family metallopeptidase [Pseudomonas schmalbachii]MBO3274905.1 M15 family metallopeptidase [Pseudomonas schmalbachii]
MDLLAPIPEAPEPDWAAAFRMPIAECGQPLQALGISQGFLVWPAYHRLGIPNALPECHARSEVFDRLLHAANLLPDGMRLVVLDAWRPFAVQQHLYDTLYDILKHHEPEADPAELTRRTREFVAPPSTRADAPSPHLTGGAVDVTLADRDGRWLNMGSLFDEATPRSYTRHYEAFEQPTKLQRRVRDHRRLLFNVMQAAGFSNLSSEWWHYDYGDQLWAWHTGASKAIYGPAQVLPLEQLWRQQLDGLRKPL